MSARALPLFVALMFAVFSASSASTAEKFPASWRKTMSNDPAVNFYLRNYTEPLGKDAATAIRNVMLARMLGSLCQGSVADKKAIPAYQAQAGLKALSKEKLKAVAFDAESSLRTFDYRALAHLCAGIDYMFGAKGVLIERAVKVGKGEPSRAYDAVNAYIRLPPFKL